jgi:hypothetical protein
VIVDQKKLHVSLSAHRCDSPSGLVLKAPGVQAGFPGQAVESVEIFQLDVGGSAGRRLVLVTDVLRSSLEAVSTRPSLDLIYRS